AGPQPGGRPGHAGGPPNAGRRPLRRLVTRPETCCSGCGRPVADCPTSGRCTGPYEPPRVCSRCGRRVARSAEHTSELQSPARRLPGSLRVALPISLGRSPADDLAMLADLRLPVAALSAAW